MDIGVPSLYLWAVFKMNALLTKQQFQVVLMLGIHRACFSSLDPCTGCRWNSIIKQKVLEKELTKSFKACPRLCTLLVNLALSLVFFHFQIVKFFFFVIWIFSYGTFSFLCLSPYAPRRTCLSHGKNGMVLYIMWFHYRYRYSDQRWVLNWNISK